MRTFGLLDCNNHYHQSGLAVPRHLAALGQVHQHVCRVMAVLHIARSSLTIIVHDLVTSCAPTGHCRRLPTIAALLVTVTGGGTGGEQC